MRCLLFVLSLVLTAASGATETLVINQNLVAKQFFPETTAKTVIAIKNAGFDVELVELPNARATVLLQSGEIDGDTFRVDTYRDSVPNARNVPVVLDTLTVVAVVAKESPFYTLDDLRNERLATVRGIQVLENIANQMGKTPVQMETFDQTLQFVELGRAGFTLLTPELLENQIDNRGNFRYIEEPILTIQTYLWLHKKHVDKIPPIQRELESVFGLDVSAPS